jgi:NDP-sugar pyrophosphorylase family protein
MVQVIISMSGYGERFKKEGYLNPKPLILVDGKPMIEHVVSMFPGVDKFIFICNKEHLETTNMKEVIYKICKTPTIVSIEPHKLGPVYAVSKAYDVINNDEETIVSYCDFGSYWNFFNFMIKMDEEKPDGCIISYKGFHPHMLGTDNYAFIKEENDFVIKVQEKKPFTDNKMNEWASNGVYYFKSGKIVKTYFTKLINSRETVNNEYYVSMVYNHMINDNLKIKTFPIQHMLQWGTPYDLNIYNGWSNYFKKIINKKPECSNPLNTITILPMAGKGSRFSMKGYNVPKPLLDINGYPMFHQAVDCLPLSNSFIFITLNEYSNKYPELENTINNLYSNVKTQILKLDTVTEGQACTCYDAIKNIDLESPILITACDNASYWNDEEYKKLLDDTSIDIIVWGFRNNPTSKNNPNMYSWIHTDNNNNILNISVKKCIVDDPFNNSAVIGTFFFRKAKYFIDGYFEMLKKNIRVQNEFYIDTMINECILQNKTVKLFDVEHYICWGIPDEYETYNYWKSFFHKTIHHPYRIYDDVTFNQTSIQQIIENNKIITCPSKQEIVFCSHQGWGDLIVATPFIYFLSQIYSKVHVIIREDAKNMIEYLNLKNVVPIYIQKNKSENSTIQDLINKGYHYIGLGNHNQTTKCTYSFLKNKNINDCILKFIPNVHYTHGFYYDYFVDISIRSNYMVYIHPETKFLNFDLTTKYIFIHEDKSRNILVNYNKINKSNNYQIIQLDNISNIFYDTIPLLNNASELHLINSSYALLVYHYQCSFGTIKAPIYIHLYSRDRNDIESFNLPSCKNIHFIY